MFKLIPLLAFLSFSLTSLYAQTEKFYFDKHWKKCEVKNMKFYRELEKENSTIIIKDYYKKGTIQFIGQIKYSDDNLKHLELHGDFAPQLLGKSVYYKKNGDIEYETIYQPLENSTLKNSGILERINTSSFSKSDSTALTYLTFYKKNKYQNGFYLKDGLEHGIWEDYNRKTNQLTYRYQFKNGVLDGDYSSYIADLLNFSVPYKNGLREGDMKIYNFSGELKKIKTYENDKVVSKIKI